MSNIKLIITDESQENIQTICNYFKNNQNVTIVGSYNNANSLLNALRVTDVDVLLINLFLPK